MVMQRHMRIVDSGIDEGGAQPALKVAFATSDRKHVDQHFGSANGFVIYTVDGARAAPLEAAQFDQTRQDGNEDKLVAKIALLEGCAAVYCQAAGASAVQQLLARGILPLKVSEGAAIAELIETLQEELRGEPSLWVAKALEKAQRAKPDRFQAMARETWDE